ncbi:MAG: DNA alkylation repair protein [Deltaproteobacteria bacterium]|nr:DNA alkylation repair protein [Deltaproteobacteria bacterium]
MKSIEELTRRVQKTEHGFKDIQKEAEKIAANNPIKNCIDLSNKLFSSSAYQARMLATFIFGLIASRSKESLSFLKKNVSRDKNWRVQEILAKSFDKYCSDIGYKNALPIIEEWLKDRNPNVRRAVTEGLRIWTGREYFKDNPEIAVRLLSRLKDDESEYVRKSVGNALRDISKKHKDLIRAELESWNISNKGIEQTYKLAGKFLNSGLSG